MALRKKWEGTLDTLSSGPFLLKPRVKARITHHGSQIGMLCFAFESLCCCPTSAPACHVLINMTLHMFTSKPLFKKPWNTRAIVKMQKPPAPAKTKKNGPPFKTTTSSSQNKPTQPHPQTWYLPSLPRGTGLLGGLGEEGTWAETVLSVALLVSHGPEILVWTNVTGRFTSGLHFTISYYVLLSVSLGFCWWCTSLTLPPVWNHSSFILFSCGTTAAISRSDTFSVPKAGPSATHLHSHVSPEFLTSADLGSKSEAPC